jgi:precorrin-2/cobalt-factor-2 C20-methyltransferase
MVSEAVVVEKNYWKNETDRKIPEVDRMNYGTLYGVGVGPGDPDLLTLKAVKTLQSVAVVFAAASSKNNYSLAVEIASPHLKQGTPVTHLDFPMTRDKKMLADAWGNNGRQVVEVLKNGKDAAFITLGDPLIYSTFGYVLKAVQKTHPEIPIKIIPGITSYQAGAAATGRILVEGNESLVVISGVVGAERLKQVIDRTDCVVMLKVYRNYGEILDALNELDLTAESVLVSRCGLDGEEIVWNLTDRDNSPPHYMSHLIIRKRR